MTNTILTEKLTTSYSTLINSQTTHQLSSNKYHRWSGKKYLIYLVPKNASIKLHPHIITHLNSVVKLFNGNNIKISYSYMANSVIRNHNTSLLKYPTPTDITECSCDQKTECPLDKNCLSECLVYNALVGWLDTNKTKHYYWGCEKRTLWQPHSIF